MRSLTSLTLMITNNHVFSIDLRHSQLIELEINFCAQTPSTLRRMTQHHATQSDIWNLERNSPRLESLELRQLSQSLVLPPFQHLRRLKIEINIWRCSTRIRVHQQLYLRDLIIDPSPHPFVGILGDRIPISYEQHLVIPDVENLQVHSGMLIRLERRGAE